MAGDPACSSCEGRRCTSWRKPSPSDSSKKSRRYSRGRRRLQPPRLLCIYRAVAAVMLTALVNLLAAPGIEPVVQLVDLRCWLALICWASAMTSGARRYAQHHAAHGHRLRMAPDHQPGEHDIGLVELVSRTRGHARRRGAEFAGHAGSVVAARAADQGDSQVTTAAIGVVRISLRSMDNVRSTR